jgi:hypothetical protein
MGYSNIIALNKSWEGGVALIYLTFFLILEVSHARAVDCCLLFCERTNNRSVCGSPNCKLATMLGPRRRELGRNLT